MRNVSVIYYLHAEGRATFLELEFASATFQLPSLRV